jgi:phage gp36-like protein
MGQFDSQQFEGAADTPVIVTECTGLYYAERTDVELAFGQTNVSKWADVNNDEDADDIETRICWALSNGHAYINDRLNGGPYAIPFELPYPTQIILCTAYFAGAFLYDSRGVTDMEDGKEKNQVSFFKKYVEEYLRGLLSNRFNLVGVTRANNSPFILTTPEKTSFNSRFFGKKSYPDC